MRALSREQRQLLQELCEKRAFSLAASIDVTDRHELLDALQAQSLIEVRVVRARRYHVWLTERGQLTANADNNRTR